MSGGKGKLRGAADGKPFKKNDERINRKGRPPKLPELDELMKEVLGEEIKGKVAMKLILLALRKKAMKGDVRATELLTDRGYGKVKKEYDVNVDFQVLTESQIDRIIDKLMEGTK
jgi:hypothetical protein